MVSFKSPVSRVAQDAISGAGDIGADFGFRASGDFSDVGPSSDDCPSMTGTEGSIGRSSVAIGVNIVHEARNKAPSKYLMASSRVPTFQ